MKPNTPSCLPFFALAALAVFMAGCASEHITADYTMPAREIADVGAVNLLQIRTAAKLSGNRVSAGDAERAASLLRRNLSACLYQEGFYQTVDSIWGPDYTGASAIGRYAGLRSSRHGYSSFASMADEATGRLDIAFVLGVDAAREERNEEIVLKSVPYIQLERADEFTVPSSIPNPNPETHSKRKVDVGYDVWKVSGKGRLKARLFEAKTGKLVYEKTFDIEPPDDDFRCEPTLLRAVSAALEPAVKAIVADISPHQESRSLKVNQDAHPRVAAFLAAKDYVDTVQEVERLENAWAARTPNAAKPYEPTFADFENKAIALEVLGQYAEAKLAWETVRQKKPDYAPAAAGIQRVELVLAGKQAIRDSGVKKSSDTGYKKEAVSKQAL